MTVTQERQQNTTSTAPAPRRAGGRLAVVDGLRLFAALAVALFHYTALNGNALWGRGGEPFGRLSSVTSYGWLGVELFFMISGFVISLSAWGRSVGGFARSRLVRLFPAYWPAVLLTAVFVSLVPSLGRPVQVRQVVVNLTMLNEPLRVTSVDLSYWTLWAEARFYLLFAVLVWFGLTRKRVVWFGFAWLIASVLAANSGMPLLVTVLQPQYAPFFVAGIGFFLIHKFGGDIRHWGLVGLSWALGMYALGARITQTGKTEHRELSLAVGMVVVTGFFVVLAVIAVGWTARIQWRWLTTAGMLTYPFYLLHQHIGATLIQHLQFLPRYVALGIVVLTMLVAAWLLHRLVERPLAGYLRNRLAPAKPVSTGAPAGSSEPGASAGAPPAIAEPLAPAGSGPVSSGSAGPSETGQPVAQGAGVPAPASGADDVAAETPSWQNAVTQRITTV